MRNNILYCIDFLRTSDTNGFISAMNEAHNISRCIVTGRDTRKRLALTNGVKFFKYSMLSECLNSRTVRFLDNITTIRAIQNKRCHLDYMTVNIKFNDDDARPYSYTIVLSCAFKKDSPFYDPSYNGTDDSGSSFPDRSEIIIDILAHCCDHHDSFITQLKKDLRRVEWLVRREVAYYDRY